MKKKSADAQLLLAAAQARLTRIRATYPCRTREIVLGRSIRDRSWRRRVPIVTISGGSSSDGESSGPVIGIG